NKMFILTKGVWKLADDAKDSIEQGRVVINANTTFNGDATFISKGSNETTVIRDGSITFTRGGIPVTIIRNMRFGTASASSSGGEIVTLNGFIDAKTNVLPSLMEFGVSNTVRSLECKATRVGVNQWRFYIRGTENTVASGNQQTTNGATASHCNVYSASIHKATLQVAMQTQAKKKYGNLSHNTPPTLPNSYEPWVTFSCKVSKSNGSSEIASFSFENSISNHVVNISKWFPYSDGNTKGTITFSITGSSANGRRYFSQFEYENQYGRYYQGYYEDTVVQSYSVTNVTTEGFLDLLVNYTGSGRVQYIAFEE
ncbi:MAG: hypothetical protein ACRC0G_03395, partial [Fusobacteriaceae bacterium]